ncbi:hypothetical protein GALMADRAFT_209673 [Galerina marginata CBS 339.88]|uniref:F-box domain-containing protein n=1 Tax=Galerina marginata (strain CBS 339.88) TaxID=685588 RepID=A0A067TH03_GALM3|nr:hypothetical protein GALMADRAFT_209673 [Galerina marginata CBS 339.88]
MTSPLETIPRDVLQHIALLCGSTSVFELPTEISRLLRTSAGIYRSLNVADTPDLYAHMFCARFDARSSIRRYQKRMTDSALAAEVLRRFRVLQRSKHLDFSAEGMEQDLWTALWMLLESDGLNEKQLSMVDFSNFILCLARFKLGDSVDGNTDRETWAPIILWLLCLVLPRNLILDMSKQDRDEFYTLIFPYIFLTSNEARSPASEPLGYTDPSLSIGLDGGLASFPNFGSKETKDPIQVYTYLRKQNLTVPDPSIAAINLTFVLLEATPVRIPYHLPQTRAIANATQRSGPTKEDYHSLASYKTPLFADTQPEIIAQRPGSFLTQEKPTRSLQHDVDFGCILRKLKNTGAEESDVFSYRPGSMTGLWEGVYRSVNLPNGNSNSAILNPLISMVMVKPMQCLLVEYFCSTCKRPPSVLEDRLLDAEICSFDLFSAKYDSGLSFRGQRYQKYLPPTRTMEDAPEALNLVYDVLLLGEVGSPLHAHLHLSNEAQTLESHDRAWGGFKFSGRIHSDGRVLLKRQPKDTSGDQGVWVFEGRLQCGVAILGRWGITGNPTSVGHGIFSLGKKLNK